jgi:NadR type nicotinamide-nucleotide adenylyltransferase
VVKRIVLTGSESTGKTELAEGLARHFDVEWVPEFVRDYAARKGGTGTLDFSDHGPIARGQMAREDEYRARAEARQAPLLIQDTDLLSTAVYCEHYYGRCPAWIAEMAQARRPDLYLLMDIDLTWQPDPQRDRGDRRPEMHALFVDAVRRSGSPYVTISGQGNARFDRARSVIERLLIGVPHEDSAVDADAQ